MMDAPTVVRSYYRGPWCVEIHAGPDDTPPRDCFDLEGVPELADHVREIERGNVPWVRFWSVVKFQGQPIGYGATLGACDTLDWRALGYRHHVAEAIQDARDFAADLCASLQSENSPNTPNMA